jgi:hypothetical protein
MLHIGKIHDFRLYNSFIVCYCKSDQEAI